MGNDCCKSKKGAEIEKFKAERAQVDTADDSSATPSSTSKVGATPTKGGTNDDEARLTELYQGLDEQFQYYLDKDFKFPTSRAELIESPEQPTLKFDIFIEFYRAAMIWNKILVMKKKYDNMKNRRKLYKTEMSKYIDECTKQNREFTVFDEDCLQKIIEKFLTRMGMQESDFQKSMIRHMADIGKMERIQQARQQIEELQFDYPSDTKPLVDKINGLIRKNQTDCDKPRDDMTTMNKAEALKIQQIMFNLVIEHQRELKQLPASELQNELAIMQLRLADKLYFTTGIESEELDASTDRLQLEEDEEYKEMVNEFTQEVQKIRLGQPE